jgi:hypothetical protein
MKVQDFIGGEDTQRSLNLSDNKCINLYPTTNNNGQITAFYKVDGLKQESVLSGIPTGAYKTSTGRAFYVTGTTLYELNTDLTSTSRGTVTAGEYSFSDNGIELICVNGTDGWILVLATNTLTQIKVLTGTFTVTLANPAVITATAHGFVATDRVLFSTTGFLPDGLTTSTPYYVIAGGLTADAFEVSETLASTAISTLGDYYTTVNNQWRSITYGNGLFVAVSNTGVFNQIMTSPNGTTWTIRTTPSSSALWTSIAWNGSIFCAVSQDTVSTNSVMTSTDGITWVSRTAASAQAWNAIAWNGTVFAAVASSGAVGVRVMTSPDGITWTSRTAAAAENWSCIAWNGSVFCAIANTGVVAAQVMTSPDGVTWTSRTSASARTWTSVAWNGAVFAAVASDGTTANNVMTSPDGITWTSRTSASARQWSSIVWNASIFVAVATTGTAATQVMTSPDGITWTSRTSASVQQWNAVTWNGSLFCAVAANGGTTTHVMTSTDGITWTNYKSYGTHTYLSSGYGFPNGCETISYMNGRFIACEPNTQNFYVSEPLDGWYWDALNVQTVDSNPDYVVGQVVSHNELIVFCETSGEVFYDSGTIPTPFVRNSSGVFEVGCLAPFSIAKLDNSVFWLGQSDEGKGCVYRLNGYNPVKISSYSIEQAIQAMTTISDAAAFSYQKDGHHFYVLTFPTSEKTFVFDANTNLWHERASFVVSEFGRWEPKDHLFFSGKHYVTDALSTNLYSLDSSTYSNGTNPCKILRSFKSPSSDMKRVRHNSLEVEGEFGIGSSAGSDPQLMMRWSDDNHTWSNLKTKSLGKVGEYAKRVIFKRLGITKGVPRVYEISCSEDVKVTLLNVYLE